MRFTTEDLPGGVREIKTAISNSGLDLDDFDITVNEDKAKIRVESHGGWGGFIVNVFASWDLDDLVTRIEESEEMS